MALGVIGLLNVFLESEEIVISDTMKLIRRDYFEKNNISMPADIRFYKTFIVSTADFEKEFNIDLITDEMRKRIPVFFLWVLKMQLTDFEIIHSDWFVGESYDNLKEMVKIYFERKETNNNLLNEWVNSFKIDNNAKLIPTDVINKAIESYEKILYLYDEQVTSPDNINLHWLYGFSKYQECCKYPTSKKCVAHVTSALEFLLVNTSDESNFRAACYSAIVAADTIEERLEYFKFLKWAYSIREKVCSYSIEGINFIDKVDLPENLRELKNILAKVLLRTMDMSNKEIQEKIEQILFEGPNF